MFYEKSKINSLKRIVIICDYFKDYKENRASYRIRYASAKAFAKRGHDVLFLYPESNSLCSVRSQQDHLQVIGTPGLFPQRFRTGGFGFLDCIFKIYWIIKFRPDVVQVVSGHRPSNLLPSLVARFLWGSRIIDECWEWLGAGGYAEKRKNLLGKMIGFYDRMGEILFKELYDDIIVISSALKERFNTKSKVHVLHGGAETKSFVSYDLVQARTQLGLPADAFFIGLSNLIRTDHDDNKAFFMALERLVEKYPYLRLIATGTDADYVAEIERIYNLKNRIVFPGYIPFSEYNLYLSACNVFVLPYPDSPINRGRWPNKLGDYLCLQRPIITNPTGDAKTIFERFKVGRLCSASAEGFYNTGAYFINNGEKAHKYCADSGFVSKELLSFDKRVDMMLDIFGISRSVSSE
jgi:glycosyltransferase involved in cell wall biosynthesis